MTTLVSMYRWLLLDLSCKSCPPTQPAAGSLCTQLYPPKIGCLPELHLDLNPSFHRTHTLHPSLITWRHCDWLRCQRTGRRPVDARDGSALFESTVTRASLSPFGAQQVCLYGDLQPYFVVQSQHLCDLAWVWCSGAFLFHEENSMLLLLSKLGATANRRLKDFILNSCVSAFDCRFWLHVFRTIDESRKALWVTLMMMMWMSYQPVESFANQIFKILLSFLFPSYRTIHLA